MTSKLKSALILLNNVYFENKKFTRDAYAKKIEEEDKKSGSSPQNISRILKFIDEIFGIKLSFRNKDRIVKIVDDNQNNYHFIKALVFNGKLKKETLNTDNHYISFSTDTDFKNSDLVFDIYEAIVKTKMIKISYQKFHTDHPRSYILKPYLIKEYLGRWYLIAENENSENRVFGIERIIDFEVLSKTFQPNITIIELYKNTIGVNYSEKVEVVKLWVEDYQLKLFETTPLHSTQKIIERQIDFGVLTIEVAVNYELKQLIASFINKVKVLGPKSLQIEMKEIFKAILKNYENKK